MPRTTPPSSEPRPTPREMLRAVPRLAGARASLWLLPAIAYTALQLRLSLGGGGAHGAGHAARLVHHLPSLKAIAPYVLGHVQALPAVGGFAVLLLVEGAVLWRARREVDDFCEPFAGVFADPRSLAFVWVAAFVAFLAGTTAGWVLGPGASGPRILLLTLPAIALTQALYTAQVVTVWLDDRTPPSLSQALWRAAPALPGLLAWELLLAGVFALVLLVQSRVLAHPGAHAPGAVRLARVAVLLALTVRASVAWVPVLLVAERCSLPRALGRAWEMWRREPWWTLAPIAALLAAFTVYAYGGAWLATLVFGAAPGAGGLRAVLGYGALALHVAGASLFVAVYRGRVANRVAVPGGRGRP